MCAILGFVVGLVITFAVLVIVDRWLPKFPTDIDGDDTWHQW